MKSSFAHCAARFVLIFLCCSLSAILTIAGTMGKISGKVTDRVTGESLVGANIIIKDMKIGSSTDINGEFFILNVPPGTYTLTVTLLGYETIQAANVGVVVDRTTSMNFYLKSNFIEGETVVITAEKPVIDKDLTASEQIIMSKVLETSGARSIKDVLETQAGFFNDNSSLAWQRGVTQSYIRGSSNVQAVYMVDNISVNSGLVSDNYSGFNMSTIEQISVLTGGYNAEYGEGRSAVVNIISKEAPEGLHGTFISRMRPAGKYHFGPNMYSEDNYDYKYFDGAYWTAQSRDANSQFYKKNPDSLLTAWRQQITPNDTLGKYAERPEYEVEGTLFGSVTSDLSFLLSGRYKRGVDIFPQAIPYNPEYNIQGYINYKFSQDIKIRLGGFIGGYESADYTSTNFNTMEMGQESGWLAPMRIDEQYARAKYNLFGAIYRQWPELRNWAQAYGKITHMINAQSFYDITVSYLKDRMDRSDRDHRVPDTLWSTDNDYTRMINRFLGQGYYHTSTTLFSQSYQVKADYTNQITQHHNIKSGFSIKFNDFHYQYFTGTVSGGKRSNSVNVFSGNPYEGNSYVQDKIEFPGLTVNAGVRVEFFNQNRDAPKNMFDPLVMEPTTPGHDPAKPLGFPGIPETERTETQVAIAPRLGISHPISDNSVLHFVYGHFYQRPSYTKMFGFPYDNYATDMTAVLNPYANQLTFMDEWQGWYGNPKLGYERTIQYELGIDNNIAGVLKLDVTGYYKDASREANVLTGVYAALYTASKPLILSNSGYSDVRGIESKIDSHFDGPFNFGLSHEVYWSFGGQVGFSRLYEPGSTNIDVPKGQRDERGSWSNYQRVKGWGSMTIEKDEGPELYGIRPLSDVNIYVNFWWRSGDQYTYHASGDQSTEPNNMRWINYYQINLKVSKGFTVAGLRTELSIDIKNLFDLKFLRLLEGDDMIRWQENPSLSERDRLPKNWFSSEPEEWESYSYEVPPRKIYFQLSVNF
jgi:hypothetical protein